MRKHENNVKPQFVHKYTSAYKTYFLVEGIKTAQTTFDKRPNK